MRDPINGPRGRRARRSPPPSGDGEQATRFLLGALEFVPRSKLPALGDLQVLVQQAIRARALPSIVKACQETRQAALAGLPRKLVEEVLPQPARTTLQVVLDAVYQQAQPRATGGPVPFEREELLRRLAQAVDGLPLAYAIGGATAMAVHGYERQTQDVDVFTTDRDRGRLLRALRQAGLDITPISEPFHYFARLPGDPDITRRIDIQVTYGEPELSGIEHAQPAGPYRLNVFTPNLLALSKFYAWDESGAARHAHDLLAMRDVGLFDQDAVRDMLASVAPERLSTWDKLIEAPAAGRAGQPGPRIRMPDSARKRPTRKPAATKKRKSRPKRPPAAD